MFSQPTLTTGMLSQPHRAHIRDSTKFCCGRDHYMYRVDSTTQGLTPCLVGGQPQFPLTFTYSLSKNETTVKLFKLVFEIK